jgi:hypothetical protein
MSWETLSFALSGLEVKDAAGNVGTFDGYASIFEVKDQDHEIVTRGAFSRTIVHSKGRFPLLWQHRGEEPIGSIEAEEDDRGLRVRGKLILEVGRAREAYALLKGNRPVTCISTATAASRECGSHEKTQDETLSSKPGGDLRAPRGVPSVRPHAESLR